MKEKISIFEYNKYFCGAYLRVLRPFESEHYKKNYITWEKMKKILSYREIEILEKNPACLRLYRVFWESFDLCKKSQKTVIEYLMFPAEINNCLRRKNIYFVEDLYRDYSTEDQLCGIRKIGEKMAQVILKSMNQYSDLQKKKIDSSIMEKEEDYLNLYRFKLFEDKAEMGN